MSINDNYTKWSRSHRIKSIVREYLKEVDYDCLEVLQRCQYSQEGDELSLGHFLMPLRVVPHVKVNGNPFCLPLLSHQAEIARGIYQLTQNFEKWGSCFYGHIKLPQRAELKIAWGQNKKKLAGFLKRSKPLLNKILKSAPLDALVLGEDESLLYGAGQAPAITREAEAILDDHLLTIEVHFKENVSLSEREILAQLEVIASELEKLALSDPLLDESEKVLHYLQGPFPKVKQRTLTRCGLEIPLFAIEEIFTGPAADQKYFLQRILQSIMDSKRERECETFFQNALVAGMQSVAHAIGYSLQSCNQRNTVACYTVTEKNLLRFEVVMPMKIEEVSGIDFDNPLIGLARDLLVVKSPEHLRGMVAIGGLLNLFYQLNKDFLKMPPTHLADKGAPKFLSAMLEKNHATKAEIQMVKEFFEDQSQLNLPNKPDMSLTMIDNFLTSIRKIQ